MKKALLFILFIFIPSFILGIHNATLYQPKHGFDGAGHVFYIEYLYKNWKLPPPRLGWETHQPPLYYAVGATLMAITKTWKTVQYINIFVLWLIVGMVGLGLWRVFKKIDQVLIGMLSLTALPMLNIFPAIITNELLNTFWIISCAVSTLFIINEKNQKKLLMYFIWLGASFIFGVWTKTSIFVFSPTFLTALILLFFQKKQNKKFIFALTLLTIFAIFFFSLPILNWASKGPSSIVRQVQTMMTLSSGWPLNFYYRLDWIQKIDMYNTQYYSLIGGAWNSFWTDGHNAITPFVKFHKKSFILWSLGFILLPLSLFGLKTLWKKHKETAIVMGVLGISMILFYIAYNIASNHYSAARLTYQMGIVLPYSFGIAGATLNKKLKPFILILLLIQFAVMVSFYWILPWWHVTK